MDGRVHTANRLLAQLQLMYVLYTYTHDDRPSVGIRGASAVVLRVHIYTGSVAAQSIAKSELGVAPFEFGIGDDDRVNVWWWWGGESSETTI